MVIFYLVLEFLAVYVAMKLYSKKMLKRVKEERGISAWADTKEFWLILLSILLGPIAMLCIIAWKLLDKLTSKLNLFKDEESK